MSGPPPPVAPARREIILDAALALFRQRGFHSVGIDEIGVAAGISGPGVYRHFPSKSSLLVALLDSLTQRILLAAEEIQKGDDPPAQMLDRLVALHAATAVEERAVVAVWLQDRRSLPASDQERLRQRQVEYIAIWVQALVRLRPELAPAHAEVLVHAALGALNSVAFHDAGLGPDELAAVIGGVARSALRAE